MRIEEWPSSVLSEKRTTRSSSITRSKNAVVSRSRTMGAAFSSPIKAILGAGYRHRSAGKTRCQSADGIDLLDQGGQVSRTAECDQEEAVEQDEGVHVRGEPC